ncbi:hypothetical protein [Endothiovibrio diazotrophicus]
MTVTSTSDSQMNSRRAFFVAEALEARQDARESGVGYEAEAIHRYLKERIMGTSTHRPDKIAWRK